MEFSTAHPVILFDGVCNFCNGAVNFLIKQDAKGHFRFAALQSNPGQEILRRFNLPLEGFQSFLLLKGDKLYQKSDAALHLLPYLPWYWQWANVGWLIPGFLRNGIYNLIARNRYRLFGKKDACMVPSPEIRARFLL